MDIESIRERIAILYTLRLSPLTSRMNFCGKARLSEGASERRDSL
jgi:hypothetical protein